ncbi:KCNJ1-like protein [Mya arenaria]|uniref:KCNJ1-like protein n=1 Tax=Mya arenaria TaxID=6604 RepID=A0ABY7DCX9_MYAAR|nr:KCNJ1-like protein [Mya arenaria]
MSSSVMDPDARDVRLDRDATDALSSDIVRERMAIMGWQTIKQGLLTLVHRGGGSARSDGTAGKLAGRKGPSRIVNREGKLQICLNQISFGKRRRYLRSPFTTLLDLKWRWTIVIFIVGFIINVAANNGDIEKHGDVTHTPCLRNVYSFTSAFLFSLESQHTIGYGSRSPTSECSGAVLMVYVQFIVGVAVQCVTAGLVVAKLQLGKRTSNAIIFSKRACVGKCNNHVCVMVRIANAGTAELLNAKGSGVIIERHTEPETGGEILSETVIEFVSDNGSSNLNLLWPTVIHCQVKTNEGAFIKRLQNVRTELILIIEGVVNATGQNVQLRTSYLPHEIDVGKQFIDISPQLVQTPGNGSFYYSVEFEDFDVMVADEQWDYSLWSPRNA